MRADIRRLEEQFANCDVEPTRLSQRNGHPVTQLDWRPRVWPLCLESTSSIRRQLGNNCFSSFFGTKAGGQPFGRGG
jgi:hypothetical protein